VGGIPIEPGAGQKGVELAEIPAIKENNRRLVPGNRRLLGSALERTQQTRQQHHSSSSLRI
jgi:hypothetical protein